MADSKTNQTIKREVMDALKKARFDLQKAEFRSYASSQAKAVLSKVKIESQKSAQLTQGQIEALVDGEIAYFSYWNAYANMVIDFQTGRRPDSRRVKEAQDAIDVLKRVGRDSDAWALEQSLANKINKR